MRTKPTHCYLLACALCTVGCATGRLPIRSSASIDSGVDKLVSTSPANPGPMQTEPPLPDATVASGAQLPDATISRRSHQPSATASSRSPLPGALPPPAALNDSSPVRLASQVQPAPAIDLVVPSGDLSSVGPSSSTPEYSSVATAFTDTIPLDLPQALSMVAGGHPVVGFARWRVQEAYAQLNQAQVMWLPTIQSGFSFHKHDGNYQASNGAIVDVDRNSFQYGLGMGATGAGTTPRPGVVAQFNLADAYFQPEIAERNAWARSHAADGVVNAQLLTVANSYLDLLSAEQDLQILRETYDRTNDVTKLTVDFAEAGEGLQADADRLQTELTMVETRVFVGRERADVAAARLAQALSLDGRERIVPVDQTVVPLELAIDNQETGSLIATGLGHRPELKEAQALVSAACEQYQRQQYAPFIPSVLLGFSTGGFGGGMGNSLANVSDRYDLDAVATWQVRNLGFGERYARQEASAQLQQAKFQQVRLLDQVAFEITEAHTQVNHRRQRMAIAGRAIQSAEKSYERNMSRIRDGQGLPIEVLQSVQALEQARRGYLQAVVDFNQAQFRLQWALGWPVRA